MITKESLTFGRLCATIWFLIFAIAALMAFECLQFLGEAAIVAFRYSGLAEGRLPLISFGIYLLIADFHTPERKLTRPLHFHAHTNG